MSGHTRKDKFRNNYIQEKVGVASIKEKITEARLRWFRHMQRRPLKALVRKIDQMDFNLMRRDKRRPKRT